MSSVVPTTETPAPSTSVPVSVENAAYADEVVRLTNLERAKVGCAPLSVSTTLAGLARDFSADMVARDYFSHVNPEGLTVFDRMATVGYTYSMAGENIAEGYGAPEAVMNAWMHSDAHKANILNCGYTQIGVGVVLNPSKGRVWTQEFGTPQ